MTPWALIYNPTSGGFAESRLEAVCRALQGVGIQPRLLATAHPGHATELAREAEGVEGVISLGGDGTLNEVANGLLGRELPLMFLPGGTANTMAYELGIPRDPVRAVPVMAAAWPRPVRPGLVGERAFLLMVGFGLDALAVYLVTGTLKKRLGALAYLWTGLWAQMRPAARLRVECPGGEELTGAWVVGARARRYGGPFSIHPRAGLTRPELGLVAVSRAMTAPFALTNMAMGMGLSTAGMRLKSLEGFTVSAPEPFHAQVDGEHLGQQTEFKVALSEQELLLCIPGRK